MGGPLAYLVHRLNDKNITESLYKKFHKGSHQLEGKVKDSWSS